MTTTIQQTNKAIKATLAFGQISMLLGIALSMLGTANESTYILMTGVALIPIGFVVLLVGTILKWCRHA